MPCDTRVTSFAVRAPTSMMAGPDVAGAEGFEPSNAGAKVPCLTTWPRPTMRDSTPHTPSGGGRPLWRMLRSPVRPPCHPSRPHHRGGAFRRELSYRRDPTSRRKPIAYTDLRRRASLSCRTRRFRLRIAALPGRSRRSQAFSERSGPRAGPWSGHPAGCRQPAQPTPTLRRSRRSSISATRLACSRARRRAEPAAPAGARRQRRRSAPRAPVPAPSNSPNTADPLPDIIASRAPAARSAATASAISGWRAATTGSKSLRQPARRSSHSSARAGGSNGAPRGGLPARDSATQR